MECGVYMENSNRSKTHIKAHRLNLTSSDGHWLHLWSQYEICQSHKISMMHSLRMKILQFCNSYRAEDLREKHSSKQFVEAAINTDHSNPCIRFLPYGYFSHHLFLMENRLNASLLLTYGNTLTCRTGWTWMHSPYMHWMHAGALRREDKSSVVINWLSSE